MVKTDIMRIALIPAYMPDEKMVSLAGALKEEGFEVVIVNDGSEPAYRYIFLAASEYATVLYHYTNKGKGEALKTGMRYIASHYAAPYTVVTADADGQHTPRDIERISRTAADMPDSLILGSRRFEGNVPLRSRLGNSITRGVFKLFSGKRVYDTQTGLRAFGNRLIERMAAVEGSRYEYEMNVLMQAAKDNIDIHEEWIETVYLDGNSSSHFRTVRDSYRIYKEILRFSASSFLSFLLDYGLFCGFSALTGNVILPNVAARVISSVMNFIMNKKLVFGGGSSDLHTARGTARSAVRYFGLAAFILVCNTLLLKALTTVGMAQWLAKILTELALFMFSYVMQHTFVFGKE